MNRVSVRNANDPMPTGQREVGTILLSSSKDGHHRSQNNIKIARRNHQPKVLLRLWYKVCFLGVGVCQVMNSSVG